MDVLLTSAQYHIAISVSAQEDTWSKQSLDFQSYVLYSSHSHFPAMKYLPSETA